MLTDVGIYEIPLCTVFGIEREEAKKLMSLCGAGLKFTDQNKEAEGYEVNTSAYKASTDVVTKSRHVKVEFSS